MLPMFPDVNGFVRQERDFESEKDFYESILKNELNRIKEVDEIVGNDQISCSELFRRVIEGYLSVLLLDLFI